MCNDSIFMDIYLFIYLSMYSVYAIRHITNFFLVINIWLIFYITILGILIYILIEMAS